MEKEIRNIVFYKFYTTNSETEEPELKWQACIFYKDGSVYNTDYEGGKEIACKFMDDNGIEDLRDIIDQKYIYRATGEEFTEMFQEFRTSDDPYQLNSEEVENVFPKSHKILKAMTGIPAFNWLKNKFRSLKGNASARKIANKEKSSVKNNVSKKEKFNDFLKTITGVKAANRLKSKYQELKVKTKEVKKAKEENPKKENFFTKHFSNTLVGKTVKRITATLVALTMLILPGCNNSKTQENVETPTPTVTDVNLDTFDGIVQASKSETQKAFMSNVSNTLDKFNITFANAYYEPGKDIKAALTWDEVVAMAMVYNNYTKSQMAEIFNGAELDTTKLSDSYKTANLQLMGAHILETRSNPVQLSTIFDSKEAKDFYNKYHEMFLQCKEATGMEQVGKVNAFYLELSKDFPIESEKREVGIAHSDPRDNIELYKFSIIPMVSAAELLFQNLEIDQTLSDAQVAYLDDLGICNRANDIIEKAYLVNLSTTPNSDYADYDEAKAKKTAELESKDAAVIDDAHRDISQLDRFKENVNVAFKYENGSFNGTIVYSDNSAYQHSETITEKTSDRSQAIRVAGLERVEQAENAASAGIKRANDQARTDAERTADEEAKRQQEEADRTRDEHNEEVAKDEKDLQDKIDDANKNQNAGGKVNENDLGHNTDFDNNHSDKDGNLDDSVKDITTDDSNDKTNEPLPDPNASEKMAPSTNKSGQTIYEYDEQDLTQEEKVAAVEAMVEAMANSQNESQTAKVYTYHK